MRTYAVALAAMLSMAATGCKKEGRSPGEPQRVEASDIDRVLAESNALLLDVREPEELEELGTIEGYVNIPIDELESRLDELPRDKTILAA